MPPLFHMFWSRGYFLSLHLASKDHGPLDSYDKIIENVLLVKLFAVCKKNVTVNEWDSCISEYFWVIKSRELNIFRITKLKLINPSWDKKHAETKSRSSLIYSLFTWPRQEGCSRVLFFYPPPQCEGEGFLPPSANSF